MCYFHVSRRSVFIHEKNELRPRRTWNTRLVFRKTVQKRFPTNTKNKTIPFEFGRGLEHIRNPNKPSRIGTDSRALSALFSRRRRRGDSTKSMLFFSLYNYFLHAS